MCIDNYMYIESLLWNYDDLWLFLPTWTSPNRGQRRLRRGLPRGPGGGVQGPDRSQGVEELDWPRAWSP